MFSISVWKVMVQDQASVYKHTYTIYVEASSARVAEKRGISILKYTNALSSVRCVSCEYLGSVYLAKGLK